MTCRLASVRPHACRTQRAWTLLEMLIAITIATMVFAAIGTTTLFTARSFVAMGNYADLDRYSRNALDIMSSDIRQARMLTNFSPTRLDFTNLDGSTFSYYSNANTLKRVYGGITTVLLTNLDYLSFNISQRNPSNNFTFYPVASGQVKLTKLVDVSWRCSRQILGQKVNTESVQTAKIVIRN